ncbi:hypothetical protein AJ80_04987, partial [Polytolypa hystricis UAMH7299]
MAKSPSGTRRAKIIDKRDFDANRPLLLRDAEGDTEGEVSGQGRDDGLDPDDDGDVLGDAVDEIVERDRRMMRREVV